MAIYMLLYLVDVFMLPIYIILMISSLPSIVHIIAGFAATALIISAILLLVFTNHHVTIADKMIQNERIIFYCMFIVVLIGITLSILGVFGITG